MEQQTGTKDCKLYVTGKDVEQCEKYLSWNGHGFDIGDDVREAQLGATQKLVLELIRESPRCMQKHIVDTIGKDQGQVAKAIDRLIEVGLVVKKEGRLMANSYHTCHIYHILCPNMTHMIGMIGIKLKNSKRLQGCA
jgi:hypothetical protein